MAAAHPSLPDLWLLSDARNDAALERILRAHRAPLGFVYRHYHLSGQARRGRFRQLAALARARGHLVILSGTACEAARWHADGCYGAPARLSRRRAGVLRIATAHSLQEIAATSRIGADAVMLSPIFPTRSHPGAKTLGPVRFLAMAKHAMPPVIALGGMDPHHARQLHWPRWAAIDGLAPGHTRPAA